MTFEEKRKAINDLRNMAIPEYSPLYSSINLAIEAIANYDSTEKVGHWIMHIDDLFPAESTMECNKCHEHQPITIDDNYCPSCGAKMQEVEE